MDDFTADITTTGRVGVGLEGLAYGEIETAGDSDWFALDGLRAGVVYQVFMSGTQTGQGTLDLPELTGVFDADGQPVQTIGGYFDRDNLNRFGAATDGPYFISAAAQSGDTGTYIVYVTERPGVMGTAGDDLLEVGRGMDWAAGLGGNDTLSFENECGNPQVFVSLEEEFTDSPQNIRISGFETLTGKWGNSDWLRGTDGPNVLSGLGGNDRLIGNGGPDTLIGGPGLDWADYTTSPDAVGVSLLSGEGWQGDADGDRLDGIERLVGSIHDDTLTGDHGDNLLSGSAGNDLLMGHDGNDTLWGGPGEDTAVFDAVRSAYVVAFAPGQHGRRRLDRPRSARKRRAWRGRNRHAVLRGIHRSGHGSLYGSRAGIGTGAGFLDPGPGVQRHRKPDRNLSGRPAGR